MTETGDDKKTDQKNGEEKKQPSESKGPPKNPEPVGDPENSPWKPGGPRKKRDGQESDEERIAKLEQFSQSALAEAEQKTKELYRKGPPRDYLTGMPLDYANIMELKPGTGDNFGEREAFASRQREKFEGSKQADLNKIKVKLMGEAASAAGKSSETTQRRDVSAKFKEGRSAAGGMEQGGEPGGRRDVSGGGRVPSGDTLKAPEEEQRRDLSGKDRDAWDSSISALDPSGSAAGRRDLTGRSPGRPEDGAALLYPGRRRDMTAFPTQ
jgi:hypothetical protein